MHYIVELTINLFSGLEISEAAINEVSDLSGVLAEGCDFITLDVRAECERIIPEVNKIRPQDAAESYMFLKAHFHNQSRAQTARV